MKPSFLILISFLIFIGCNEAARQPAGEEAAIDSVQQAIESLVFTEEEQGPSVKLDTPLILSYQMTPGDEFGYSITNIEDVTIVQDTIENLNRQEVTWWYHFEVLGSGDQGTRLRVHCDRVVFQGEYNGPDGKQSIHYDSDAENSYDVEKRFAQWGAPVGAPFTIIVEEDGRIGVVSNLQEVVKNYLKDDYRTTRSDQLESIARDYADSGLKNVLQLAFQKMSTAPVRQDSTWTLVRPERIGYLAVRNEATYRLRDVVESALGPLAQINVTISSSFVGDETMDTGQGLATMKEFDVHGKGSTVFNINVGRLQRRRLVTNVYVNMWVEPPDELKELTKGTDQAVDDFWWSSRGRTENIIEPYQRQ
ncbi:MAG: hypothetical protein KFH87_06795 [Bacteroidetes bacterium]|nr:hypothetical protein [Bacteroidota bacterium]